MSVPPPGLDEALVERLAEQVAGRAEHLRRRIAAAARQDVTVVAVTKGHPPEVAAAARRCGFRDLGENYAAELAAKAEALSSAPGPGPAVRWHFVGRLQTNKVRRIAPVVALWQSVDRPSVVRELAHRAPGATVLVQVDLAGIPGRGGCDRDGVADLVASASDAGLAVRGVMGVGPPGEPEDAREGFRWLRAAADSLGLAVVSMGMSADLEVALEEGATMVRVGSALVGPRPLR